MEDDLDVCELIDEDLVVGLLLLLDLRIERVEVLPLLELEVPLR